MVHELNPHEPEELGLQVQVFVLHVHEDSGDTELWAQHIHEPTEPGLYVELNQHFIQGTCS